MDGLPSYSEEMETARAIRIGQGLAKARTHRFIIIGVCIAVALLTLGLRIWAFTVQLSLASHYKHATNLPHDLESFKGKKVDQFLRAYSLNLSQAQLYDEPPGQLSSLKFRKAKQLYGKSVEVEIEHSEALSLFARKWDTNLIRETAITGFRVW